MKLKYFNPLLWIFLICSVPVVMWVSAADTLGDIEQWWIKKSKKKKK